MRNLLGFLVGVLLVSIAAVAMAAEGCTLWRVSPSGAMVTLGVVAVEGIDKEEICHQIAQDHMDASAVGNTNLWRYVNFSVTTTCNYRRQNSSNGGASWGNNGDFALTYTNLGATECPPDPCEEFADQSIFGTGDMGLGDGCHGSCAVSSVLPTTAIRCNAASGECASVTTGIGYYKYTGVSCDAEPAIQKGNCVAAPFGRLCAKESVAEDTQVSVGNDQFRPDELQGCVSFVSGGVACVVTGPGAAEVLPDDGDEMDPQPVEPVAIAGGETQTVNYYTPEQVSGSTVSVLTGSGSASGDQPGVVGGDGDGDGPGLDELEGGDMGEVCDIGDCAEGFWDRVEGSPIVSAVSGIGGSLGEGACPDWSDTIDAGAFGTYELDFAFICPLWDDLAPVISAVMLAGFAFAGLRILMSA